MNSATPAWNTSPEFNPDDPSVVFDEHAEIFEDAKNGDVAGGNARTSR